MCKRALGLLSAFAIAALSTGATVAGHTTIRGSVSIKGAVATTFAARTGSPIGTSTGSTPEAGGRVYAQDFYVPSDVTSLRVRIGNRTYSAGVAAFSSTVAVYTSDGTGLPSGTAWGTASVTVPGDGTIVQTSLLSGARGSDGKVVVLFGVPQGTSIAYDANVQFGNYVAGTTTVSPIPGGLGANAGSTACVHLAYSTGKRRIVVFGDSITVGYSTGTPIGFENTAFQLIAAHKDWSVDAEGVVQIGSLATFADHTTNPFLWDEEDWTGNPDLVINLGTNDIPGQSLATMQSNLAAIIAYFHTKSTGNVYASTIPPQAAYADAGNVRTGFNTWLLANYAGQGITAVRDRNAKQNVGGLADNTTGTTLFATYDTGDGTHINAAGNTQEKTGWEAIL